MSIDDNALFLTTAGGIVVGIIGLILRYCYKIKCEDISICCGLFRFHRNIDDELQFDLENAEGIAARRRGSLNNASHMTMMPPSRV